MRRLVNFLNRLEWLLKTKFSQFVSDYILDFINGQLKQKYFVAAIIIAGCVGIWLPILVEFLVERKVKIHNIPSNVITYFVSILFTSLLDNFLSKIKNRNINQVVNLIMNLILVGFWGFSLALIAIILNVLKFDTISLIVSFIGVLTAWKMWWYANEGNSNLEPSVLATMGGDTSKIDLIDG